jgi:hypothetical protein
MSNENVKPRSWKLLLIIGLILALASFTSIAAAQEEQPEEQQTNAQTAVDVTIPDTGTDEFAQEANARMMATTAERQQARQMQHDYDWRCGQGQFVVLGGESLGHIARNCGVPLDFLLAANPQIGFPDLVFAGELVNMPNTDADPRSMTLTAQQAQYLADRFGIAIAQAEVSDPVIPETGSAEFAQETVARRLASEGQIQRAEAQRFDYAQRCEQGEFVILRGESLGHITANCGIPLDWILAVNRHISFPDLVFAGELVTLPDPDTDPATLPLLTEPQLNYLQQTGLAGEPIEAEEVDDTDNDNDVEDEETEENDS